MKNPLLFICLLLLLFYSCNASTTLVIATNFTNIYDPSDEIASWYINDHTFIMGPGGDYHLFGITHTNPADPTFEVNFAHATSPNLTTGWMKQPFGDGSSGNETHLWAPHIVYANNLYYMYYCGGGNSDTDYQINLAISTDLWKWTKYGTLFTDGWDGRDPMVVNLGPLFNNTWAMYYCATNPNSGSGSVDHVTYVRTSTDLLHWSNSQLAFNAGATGSPDGGPTESPFVVRRGSNFYLFSGSWASYSDTRVFLSTNPFDFGDVTQGTQTQVGEIYSHAPEVTRDIYGNWYISRAGWGEGGVFLAPMTWQDGLDDADTSMPPPVAPPAIPANFVTSFSEWNYTIGNWVQTPDGLQGGYVYGDAFYMSSTQGTNFTYQADLTLVTKDGNPTAIVGSAASIVFRSQSNPEDGCYVLNIHTDLGGGVRLFKFPYEIIQEYNYNILQDITYTISVQVIGDNFIVSFGEAGSPLQVIMKETDSSYSSGYFGVDVWQGSAFYQNVLAKF